MGGNDTPDRIRRQRKIFVEALEKEDPEERAAFLATVCAGDPELQREIATLLAAETGTPESFLDSETAANPGVELPPQHAAGLGDREEPEQWIGRYRLLEPIGEGGMGEVWLAEQREPMWRKVALKIIKRGMDSKEILARFEAERQALALMDHPSIASVLDAGDTEDGRPFFVMEYVQGPHLTDYCDRRKLPLEERLTLFVQVCKAVQHAHQKGIIHRDIKPSNILVATKEDKAIPKVIDFGVAKALGPGLTEHTLYTAAGQLIGTPQYMSPEQAEFGAVDVDTRSDIYSLGILLYELLTGRAPLELETLRKAGFEEVLRMVREEEPHKPSTRIGALEGEAATTVAELRRMQPGKFNHMLKGDLDWIVMKALEKDRSRRYETANAFSLDILRYLSNEPVQAAAPSVLYKMRKFARRNRTAFGVATLIASVLVVATAVSAWQAVRATKARNEAEAVSDFLTEVFQSPDPERDTRTVTMVETLDFAAEKLETELVDQPERRAKLRTTLGFTYHALGQYEDAISMREKVRDFYLATLGPDHPETLGAMHILGQSCRRAERKEEAIALFEEVLNKRKRFGGEDRDTLWTMQELAISYFDEARHDEAMAMREEALALSRNVNGPEDPDTLWAMGHLAESYGKAGRLEEAVAMSEEVLRLRRRNLGLEHSHTVYAMTCLSTAYIASGRQNEALAMREEVLALRRSVSGDEHPDTVYAMNQLANSYYDAGRKDEALAMREDVLRLSREKNGAEHPVTLDALTSLAQSYHVAGRLDEALELREQALPLHRKRLRPEHPWTVNAQCDLAISLHATGNEEEAMEMLEEGLEMHTRILGPGHPDTVRAMSNLAGFYGKAGKAEAAAALQRELAQLELEADAEKEKKPTLSEPATE